jgi:hypothetical protein
VCGVGVDEQQGFENSFQFSTVPTVGSDLQSQRRKGIEEREVSEERIALRGIELRQRSCCRDVAHTSSLGCIEQTGIDFEGALHDPAEIIDHHKEDGIGRQPDAVGSGETKCGPK